MRLPEKTGQEKSAMPAAIRSAGFRYALNTARRLIIIIWLFTLPLSVWAAESMGLTLGQLTAAGLLASAMMADDCRMAKNHLCGSDERGAHSSEKKRGQKIKTLRRQMVHYAQFHLVQKAYSDRNKPETHHPGSRNNSKKYNHHKAVSAVIA